MPNWERALRAKPSLVKSEPSQSPARLGDLRAKPSRVSARLVAKPGWERRRSGERSIGQGLKRQNMFLYISRKGESPTLPSNHLKKRNISVSFSTNNYGSSSISSMQPRRDLCSPMRCLESPKALEVPRISKPEGFSTQLLRQE